MRAKPVVAIPSVRVSVFRLGLGSFCVAPAVRRKAECRNPLGSGLGVSSPSRAAPDTPGS